MKWCLINQEMSYPGTLLSTGIPVPLPVDSFLTACLRLTLPACYVDYIDSSQPAEEGKGKVVLVLN
jgi:hypothetical protein